MELGFSLQDIEFKIRNKVWFTIVLLCLRYGQLPAA
jgi:hypothetical protein